MKGPSPGPLDDGVGSGKLPNPGVGVKTFGAAGEHEEGDRRQLHGADMVEEMERRSGDPQADPSGKSR